MHITQRLQFLILISFLIFSMAETAAQKDSEEDFSANPPVRLSAGELENNECPHQQLERLGNALDTIIAQQVQLTEEAKQIGILYKDNKLTKEEAHARLQQINAQFDAIGVRQEQIRLQQAAIREQLP
jgi:hypothetical protein